MCQFELFRYDLLMQVRLFLVVFSCFVRCSLALNYSDKVAILNTIFGIFPFFPPVLLLAIVHCPM